MPAHKRKRILLESSSDSELDRSRDSPPSSYRKIKSSSNKRQSIFNKSTQIQLADREHQQKAGQEKREWDSTKSSEDLQLRLSTESSAEYGERKELNGDEADDEDISSQVELVGKTSKSLTESLSKETEPPKSKKDSESDRSGLEDENCRDETEQPEEDRSDGNHMKLNKGKRRHSLTESKKSALKKEVTYDSSESEKENTDEASNKENKHKKHQGSKKSALKKEVTDDSSESETENTDEASNKGNKHKKQQGSKKSALKKEVTDDSSESETENTDEASNKENKHKKHQGSNKSVLKKEVTDDSSESEKENNTKKNKASKKGKTHQKKQGSKTAALKKEVTDDSSESETENTDEASKKENIHQKKQDDKDNSSIVLLKRCIWACGKRKNYKKMFEDCSSANERSLRLKEELRDIGIRGEITLAKCKRWKENFDEEEEFKSLDQKNIIKQSPSRGRTKRSNVRSRYMQGKSKPTPSSDEEERESPTDPFKNLRGGIISDDSCSD